MITHIKVENYLSYNKETILSFDCKSPAVKSDIFKKNTLLEKSSEKVISYFNDQGRRRVVMNSLVVYGPNASGKTNIVSIMRFLKESIVAQKINFKRLMPFQFVKDKNPISKVEIGFIDEVYDKSYRFIYRLEIDKKNQEISKEMLSYSSLKGETLQIIFKRSNGKLDYVQKDVQKIFRKILLDNIQAKPLLALAINNINRDAFLDEVSTFNYKLIECAFDTIAKKIVFAREGGALANFEERLHEDEKFKSDLLTRLSDFDFSISDIETEDITSLILDRLELALPNVDYKGLPKGLLKLLADDVNEKREYKITTKHRIDGEEFSLPISLESSGTRRFIKEFLYIYDAIKNGKLYICDEFEAGYHNEIQLAILNALFEGAQESGSQFIIFTHNTNLLSPELFAKEQIVFIEKDRESQSSDIYKLSEYSDVTYHKHNWAKMYLEGRFGAIPEVY